MNHSGLVFRWNGISDTIIWIRVVYDEPSSLLKFKKVAAMWQVCGQAGESSPLNGIGRLFYRNSRMKKNCRIYSVECKMSPDLKTVCVC